MPSQFPQLPTFEGYLVDTRLGEFRSPSEAGLVIPFRSSQGRKLLARMHGECDASIGDQVRFTEAGLARVGQEYRGRPFIVTDDPDVAATFDRDAVGDQFRLEGFEGPVHPAEIETVRPSLMGTKVGPRSTAEIEQLLREDGYDLTFDTGDNGLFVEVTWYEGRASVLVLCHNREEYSRGYDSLQHLRDGQPWDLSRFDIVERTREDESAEDPRL